MRRAGPAITLRARRFPTCPTGNTRDTALAHLNRAGEQGWELVSVSENPSLEGNSELHRYHLKRTAPAPAPRSRLGGGSRGVRRPRE
ncbi:hypothetical protein Ais01nite_52160 [Asanoa ishikariensis]|uniref:DUF4177 domain-containing protein n=1 Tax=Asanoa ishikariensis TaxID=137265 RepID=A0A1H3RJD1_9ACTN|nr:hypothetical protein Ais01nite_52160 [Asanoa ishikariensis]SDZ25465.1 hypothetical protein SAMN05421684_3862 [Asanoa ishikariensis]